MLNIVNKNVITKNRITKKRFIFVVIINFKINMPIETK